MIHEATATGESVEIAATNAIQMLAAPLEAEVKTDILEYPKKKVLGLFGGAPAKVRAYYETPDKPEVKAAPAAKSAPKAAAPAAKPAERKPKPASKPAQKPVKTEEVTAEPAPEIERKKIAIDASKPGLEAAKDYLTQLITLMGAETVAIEAYELPENEILLEIDCGEDYGLVIGRRGETLDSIQYLTRLTANRKKSEGEYSRISINVGNYREKRKSTLSELAKKNSAKVLKYGRNVTFEPMNPYERRIIHTTVQEIEGVTSYSVGTDADRRVVITLEEGVKPTHPSKGGYNRGRQGARGRQGGRGPRKNNTYKADAPTRAPKTDAGAEGFSLYGKLN